MREMKDSGIEWVGKIPKGWSICPLYMLFSERKNRNSKGQEINLLSLSYGRIIRKNININTGLLPESFNTYNIVEKDDIIIRPTDLQNDKRSLRTGIVKEHGIITSAYIALKPKKYTNSSYFHYLLHAYDIKKVFYNMGNGVRQGLNYSEFCKLLIINPTNQEQSKIINFLDAKCADIDSLTADIQKQIDILKEYKKSVITQAVTKGLDPNVEMKDSGVGWIGMIPSKWNIGKIKSYVDKVGSGKTPKGDNTLYTKGKILFLRSQNVYNTGIILDDPPTVITDAIDKELSNTRVITDDVLLNITGGSIGRCCIYNLEKKANVNQHVSIIRMKKDKMLSGYMHYFWISDLGQTAINLYQTGGNREGMSASAIKNTPIPFMSIWEQQAIIDFLDSKCADIDAIISGKQKQLDVLKEYKKSLIYEYVTGKKEVPCHE